MGPALTILSAGLACWLVEPGLDVKLPLLLEVLVGQHVVVRHHTASSRPYKELTLKPSGYYTQMPAQSESPVVASPFYCLLKPPSREGLDSQTQHANCPSFTIYLMTVSAIYRVYAKYSLKFICITLKHTNLPVQRAQLKVPVVER